MQFTPEFLSGLFCLRVWTHPLFTNRGASQKSRPEWRTVYVQKRWLIMIHLIWSYTVCKSIRLGLLTLKYYLTLFNLCHTLGLIQQTTFFFFFFPHKIGFDASCKLSPEETVCMKRESLFSGKNQSISPEKKETYFKLMSAATFTLSVHVKH